MSLPALFPSPGGAGAFLQPAGEGQVIVTTAFSDATKAYDARGRLISAPSFSKFEVRTYVEYGAADWLTIVAEPSYMNFRGASPQFDQLNLLIEEAKAGAPLLLPSAPRPRFAGIGSGWLGARVRLVEFGSLIISLEASLRAATPSARQFLDMKGQFQEDVRLQFGRPIEFFGMAGFADAQIGYRGRGQNGDEIRADFTYGLRPFDDVLLLAQSFTAVAPWDSGSTFTASQKFELSAVYDVTNNISVQLGALAAVHGINASAERGVVSALWYRF